MQLIEQMTEVEVMGTGTSYDISISEITGVSINDLIDKGLRFNIVAKDEEQIDVFANEDDENNEEIIHNVQ